MAAAGDERRRFDHRGQQSAERRRHEQAQVGAQVRQPAAGAARAPEYGVGDRADERVGRGEGQRVRRPQPGGSPRHQLARDAAGETGQAEDQRDGEGERGGEVEGAGEVSAERRVGQCADGPDAEPDQEAAGLLIR